MKAFICFIAICIILLSACKKEPDPVVELKPAIKSLSDDHVKYGSTLTINGENFSKLSATAKVLITDSVTNYLLAPKSITNDEIEVEIYNQQSPIDLLSLSYFYVGIIDKDTLMAKNQHVDLITSWNRVSDFPGTERYKSSAFTLQNKIYVGGGANGGVFKDFWEYNPQVNSWTRKADIPGVARAYPRSFSNSVNGFLGCGYSADNSSKIQLYDYYKYDPQADTWTSVLDYPDNISGYYVGYSVTCNNRPFISLSNQLLSMREWSNGTWISVTTIPEMIDCPAAGVFAIDKKFYVVVGNRINNAFSNSVWEFNTETSTWAKKSDFPGPARFAPAFFSIGDYGYYGCGMATNQQQFKDMWRYDPANDKWIRLEDFPGGLRSHLISSSQDVNGFIGLGIDFSTITYKNDFWKFSPQ